MRVLMSVSRVIEILMLRADSDALIRVVPFHMLSNSC